MQSLVRPFCHIGSLHYYGMTVGRRPGLGVRSDGLAPLTTCSSSLIACHIGPEEGFRQCGTAHAFGQASAGRCGRAPRARCVLGVCCVCSLLRRRIFSGRPRSCLQRCRCRLGVELAGPLRACWAVEGSWYVAACANQARANVPLAPLPRQIADCRAPPHAAADPKPARQQCGDPQRQAHRDQPAVHLRHRPDDRPDHPARDGARAAVANERGV
jgi:hypothetical protein